MMILGHYQAKSETTEERKQSLEEHLLNVAASGRRAAESIGQGDVLFLLGLYHDLGKADRLFQRKLTKQPKLHVDHSYAGAKYLFGKIKTQLSAKGVDKAKPSKFNDIVAYVISAHHGMFDIFDKDSEQFQYNKLRNRICKQMSDYHFDSDVKNFAHLLEAKLEQYGYRDLEILIDKAFENYQQALSKLEYQDSSEEAYYQSCLVRLYLSLLKNADILDTINAYGVLIDPLKQDEKNKLNKSYLKAIEDKYRSFAHPTTKLNVIRTQISERVKYRGEHDSTGIYRLDLPTGAGKTNLSMRYAFHQLIHQKKSRFFYITPFLSVLEQNASEIRKITGEAGVLEHHSNVVRQTDEDENDAKEAIMSDYLIDSWDSQIVLTSMVQFFQTLFKTKSSNVRRFSSLIDSVLILDEVQSLPIEVTTLFNLTMNFLTKVMNTTIILCTATQPVYDSESMMHRISYGGENGEEADLVDLSQEEKESFSRTELRKFDDNNQQSKLSDLVTFVLEKEESILVIFNTKKTVDRFYSMLEDETDRPIYQLSTNMCAQHRLDVISKIKQQLKDGLPIICISTQLIEAGVDVDFYRVLRSYAGIDSIVQASGRCNREGKRDKGQVTLVNLTNEEESISRLKEIKAKKDSTEYILHHISSPIEISPLNREFFEYYYANNQGSMDYPLESPGESVYDYLSINEHQCRKQFKGALKQAFKKAGSEMNLINNESIGIFVPYGEAIEKLSTLEALCESDFLSKEDWQAIKTLLKELQTYTVNVREHDPLLEATKTYLNGQIRILSDGYYDEKKGITLETGSFLI